MLYFANHHCLLWVQNLQNHTFSAFLKKSKVNFFFNANVFGRTHGSRLCVLRSLYGLSGQRCYLESPRLQHAKHATSAKHVVDWDWSVFKCSDTNLVFQTAILLTLVVRNNKRSSGIDGKTSDCLFRISLYYRYLELRFC